MARPFLSTAVVGAQKNVCIFGLLFTHKFFTISDFPLVISVLKGTPGSWSALAGGTGDLINMLMLMLELGSLLKHLHQERATENRRHSSSVDYSWLAAPPHKSSYEIPAGEMLEFQDLCAKVSPSQCSPLILR